jgi:hypothetical protein
VKPEVTEVNARYKNICTVDDPQLPITAPTRVRLIAAGGPIDNSAPRVTLASSARPGSPPALAPDTVDFVMESI